jgi:hypothetical protein
MHDAVTTFRPSFWRCYLVLVLPLLLVVLVVSFLAALIGIAPMAGTTWFDRTGIQIIIWVVLGVLPASWMQDRLMIMLDTEVVSGPGSSGWQRVSFPIHMVDRERTCRQTMLQRIGGDRYLWSTDGHKIRVNTWGLSQAEVNRLLTHVGCIEGRSSS